MRPWGLCDCRGGVLPPVDYFLRGTVMNRSLHGLRDFVGNARRATRSVVDPTFRKRIDIFERDNVGIVPYVYIFRCYVAVGAHSVRP